MHEATTATTQNGCCSAASTSSTAPGDTGLLSATLPATAELAACHLSLADTHTHTHTHIHTHKHKPIKLSQQLSHCISRAIGLFSATSCGSVCCLPASWPCGLWPVACGFLFDCFGLGLLPRGHNSNNPERLLHQPLRQHLGTLAARLLSATLPAAAALAACHLLSLAARYWPLFSHFLRQRLPFTC